MGHVSEPLRSKLKQSRAFIFALIAIFFVWLVTNMSEEKVFREQYQVQYLGIDTARYVVTQCDTVITLDITSNGFYAFRRGIGKNHKITLDVEKYIARKRNGDIKITLNTDEIIYQIRNQIDMRGVSKLQPVSNNIAIDLGMRESKAFVPNIDDVEFVFDNSHGLYGQPLISPDTVWLYGTRESLDKIDGLYASKQKLDNISASGNYIVKLNPVWEKYPDLKVSTSNIDVYLPVETFVEKAIEVPVNVKIDESVREIKLYPPTVTVNVMVSSKDYTNTDAKDFKVTSTINSDTSTTLRCIVSEFPAYVHIKSIEPPTVQYVVIK